MTFPVGYVRILSRIKSGNELHMKRKHNDTAIENTPSPTNWKVSITWFAFNSYKVLKKHRKGA